MGKSLPGISGRDFLFAGYCSRLAQTVTDFADASHSESAKSTTTTVLYGIFSSENSYPCTVTFPGHIKRGFSHDKRMNDCLPPILFSAIFKLLKVLPDTELDAC